MSMNELISIIAILTSIFSLYKTNQNKKVIQQNEFDFTKRKVWYDKQNEVIDKSIEIMMEMHQTTGEIITYAKLKKSNSITQEDKYYKGFQERVGKIIISNRYLISHKHYFSKNMEKNVEMILKLCNDISSELNKKVINFGKDNEPEIEIETYRTDLNKIPIYIEKIIKEVRKEHLKL